MKNLERGDGSREECGGFGVAVLRATGKCELLEAWEFPPGACSLKMRGMAGHKTSAKLPFWLEVLLCNKRCSKEQPNDCHSVFAVAELNLSSLEQGLFPISLPSTSQWLTAAELPAKLPILCCKFFVVLDEDWRNSGVGSGGESCSAGRTGRLLLLGDFSTG